MRKIVTKSVSSLPSEDVIVRAVPFFASGRFRTGSQSSRVAAFDGRPPIPWFMILLTVLGFAFCIVPGIVMYILVIRKMYQFQNIIVSANPIEGGSEISVTHPDWASGLVRGFIQTLPPFESDQSPAVLLIENKPSLPEVYDFTQLEKAAIYILVNGEQEGPYPFNQVQCFLREGKIAYDSLVWHEGLSGWITIGSIVPESKF